MIRSSNPADMAAVEAIIKYVLEEAAKTEIEINLIPLKNADATSVVNMLNQLYARVVVGPYSNTQIQVPRTQGAQPGGFPGGGFPGGGFGGFGQQNQNQAQAGAVATSLVLIPIVRQNAILLAAPKSRVETIKAEISRLDIPPTEEGKAVAFPLKRAAAKRVGPLVSQFYSFRYPNETTTQNQIRVTWDDGTNTVFVQAAPADLVEIRSLIEHIDNMGSTAVNDLRIVPLKSAIASDLAAIVAHAVSDNFTLGTGATTAGGVGAVGGAGACLWRRRCLGWCHRRRHATGRHSADHAGPDQGQGPAPDDAKGRPVRRIQHLRGRSHHVRSAHQYAHHRCAAANHGADPRLDPATRRAAQRAGLGQCLHAEAGPTPCKRPSHCKSCSSTSAASAAQRPPAAAGAAVVGLTGFGGAGAVGGTTGGASLGSPQPLQFSISGISPQGAPLIDLRLTVDERTNSIIAAGSRNDLDVIEAIIAKLETTDPRARRSEAYQATQRLGGRRRRCPQRLLARSRSRFTPPAANSRATRSCCATWPSPPEPISNTLLISASPQYFDTILRLIADLDVMPPQVVIQVLVAEVDVTNSDEFGVEIGLQSPVIFNRGLSVGSA